jgi:hypothetical protein
MTDGPDPFATTPAGGGGGVKHTATVAGAVAGDVTVSGMTAAATIVSVVAVATPTHHYGGTIGTNQALPFEMTVTPLSGEPALGVTDVVEAVHLGNAAGTRIDYTSNFNLTPTGTNKITQTGGGATNTFDVWVYWRTLGAAGSTDLTAEFTAASGKINNTGGTSSLGKTLIVSWTAAT